MGKRLAFILFTLIVIMPSSMVGTIAFANEIQPMPPKPTPEESMPKKLVGLNFGPFRDGRDPTRGAVIRPAEIEEALQILKPYATWIRTYGTGNGLDQVGKIAHQLNMKVAAGAWLGRDYTANDREIARIIQLGQAGELDIAVVGNETLLRGDLTVSQLIGYVMTVKEALPDIPVTTAESHHLLLRYPALMDAVDVIFMHYYPYWNGIPIDRAISSLATEYAKVKNAAEDKVVFVAETGWPSGGDTIGQAVPSPENAARYLREFLMWAGDDVPYLYFAAFDEPWKAAHEGPQGAHWGLWDRFDNLKPEIREVLESLLDAE